MRRPLQADCCSFSTGSEVREVKIGPWQVRLGGGASQSSLLRLFLVLKRTLLLLLVLEQLELLLALYLL